MNKISDTEIKNILRQRCEEIKNQIGEDRLFGVFVIGKALYGMAEQEEDIKTIAGYIPTEDELYLSAPKYQVCIHKKGSKENIETQLTDFRCLLEKIEQQDLNIMESIFSEYKVINRRYEEEYIKQILDNKEIIFKYKPYDRIYNAINRGYEAIKNKNYLEACRIRFACKEYVNGASISDCIYLKKDFYLRYLDSVKKEEFIPDIIELQEDYKDILLKAKDMVCHYDVEKYFKDFIKNTIIKANKDTVKVKNILEFLTDKEKQALDLILSKLKNGEGTVSISKLLEESDLSRPVFKSALQKIEKYYLAEVINQGMKGFYIKILDNCIFK